MRPCSFAFKTRAAYMCGGHICPTYGSIPAEEGVVEKDPFLESRGDTPFDW